MHWEYWLLLYIIFAPAMIFAGGGIILAISTVPSAISTIFLIRYLNLDRLDVAKALQENDGCKLLRLINEKLVEKNLLLWHRQRNLAKKLRDAKVIPSTAADHAIQTIEKRIIPRIYVDAGKAHLYIDTTFLPAPTKHTHDIDDTCLEKWKKLYREQAKFCFIARWIYPLMYMQIK